MLADANGYIIAPFLSIVKGWGTNNCKFAADVCTICLNLPSALDIYVLQYAEIITALLTFQIVSDKITLLRNAVIYEVSL